MARGGVSVAVALGVLCTLGLAVCAHGHVLSRMVVQLQRSSAGPADRSAWEPSQWDLYDANRVKFETDPAAASTPSGKSASSSDSVASAVGKGLRSSVVGALSPAAGPDDNNALNVEAAGGSEPAAAAGMDTGNLDKNEGRVERRAGATSMARASVGAGSGSGGPACPLVHLPGGRVVKCTDPTVIAKLYDQMRAIHDIFSEAGLEYWALGGTLLGAIRHKGIIPWDDDNDIAIPIDKEQAFLSLAPKFAARGYEFYTHKDFGYKIQAISDPVNPKLGHKFPFTDVFLNEFDGSGLGQFPVCFKNRPTWECWRSLAISKDEVYPLTTHSFGDFKISVPGGSDHYLDRVYTSPHWRRYALAGRDHANEKAEDETPIGLDQLPSGPALPFR